MTHDNVENKLVSGRINRKYLYADFSKFPEINEELRVRNASRIFTGGVRINNNMYRTKEETESYINESLNRKLP